MAGFEKCGICGEYGFTRSHRCPPVFYCSISDERYEGYQDDRSKVFANSPEKAAAKFIERQEQHWVNYDVAAGKEEIEVEVWPVAVLDDLHAIQNDIESFQSSLSDPDYDLEPEDRAGMEAELEDLRLSVPPLEAKKQIFVVSGESIPHYYANPKTPTTKTLSSSPEATPL